MKILANDGISNEGKVALEKAGYTVITDKVAQDDLIDYVNANNVEIILVRSATTIRQVVIDSCSGLKLLGRGGVGMDNIDVAYAMEKGLSVINTPASSSQSVAELVMGHLFAGARSLHDSFKQMETGDFSALKKKYAKGIELRGKTIAIVGFGRIGQSLASYALGCGMKVIAVNNHDISAEIPLTIHGVGEIKVNIQSVHDLHAALNIHFDFSDTVNGQSLASYALGCGMKVIAVNNHDISAEIPLTIHGVGEIKVNIQSVHDLHAALKEADFVSLHIPKQSDGTAVIKKAEFDLMKKGVVLVNAARGGVIDESALLEAIAEGKVAYAGLDVFENEPNPRADLLNNEKIGTTPHIGAATGEAQDRIGLELADLIVKQFGVQVPA